MSALFWLFMTLFWSGCMSFFSTQEMACISYNRLKLEVEARAGSKRARWIQKLLQRPTALFGTTLFGVNLSLVITSESLRQLFSALSFNPNFSVFFLVPYLVLFGELIPMFAARSYPEHTAKLGSPILWVCSLIVRPFASLLESILQFCFKPWLKEELNKKTLFQHEELQEMVRPLVMSIGGKEDPTAHLFFTVQKMREKKCMNYMTSFKHLLIVTEGRTAGWTLNKMREAEKEVSLVSSRQGQITGIVTDESLLLSDHYISVSKVVSPTSFLHEGMSASKALSKMLHDNRRYALVLNNEGSISGLLSIESLLDEFMPRPFTNKEPLLPHLSKTVDASMRIGDFCRKYEIHLDIDQNESFSSYLTKVLDHKPKVGEKVLLGYLEATVKETSILGVKKVFVRTLA